MNFEQIILEPEQQDLFIRMVENLRSVTRENPGHNGSLKFSVSKKLADERYDDFNEKRKHLDARSTGGKILEELKQIDEKVKKWDK